MPDPDRGRDGGRSVELLRIEDASPSARSKRDAEVAGKIAELHENNHGVYGSPAAQSFKACSCLLQQKAFGPSERWHTLV